MATAINDTASTLNHEGNHHSNKSRKIMVTMKYVKHGIQINQQGGHNNRKVATAMKTTTSTLLHQCNDYGNHQDHDNQT